MPANLAWIVKAFLGLASCVVLPLAAARCCCLTATAAASACRPAAPGGPVRRPRHLRGVRPLQRLLADRAGARGAVGQVVVRVAVHLVRRRRARTPRPGPQQRVDLPDQVGVGDRLLPGGHPPVPLPRRQPLGHGVDRVLRIQPRLHPRPRPHLDEQLAQSGQLGDVVGRVPQRPRPPPQHGPVGIGQDPGPRRRTGVPFGGAVTGGDEALLRAGHPSMVADATRHTRHHPAFETDWGNTRPVGYHGGGSDRRADHPIRPLWRNWQRTCLVNRRLGVRVPSAAPVRLKALTRSHYQRLDLRKHGDQAALCHTLGSPLSSG